MRKDFDARSWLPGSTTLHTMTDQGGFTIEKGYTSMFPQYQKADWSKLALVKGLIPRHHFIMWLALHRKLSTVDRVIKWGIAIQTECVLCDTHQEENFDHLFFA